MRLSGKLREENCGNTFDMNGIKKRRKTARRVSPGKETLHAKMSWAKMSWPNVASFGQLLSVPQDYCVLTHR